MKVQLELFTANVCPRCAQAKSDLSGMLEVLGEDDCILTFVDVVENIDRAVELGILAMPALVVNGKLVFAPLPARDIVLQALRSELET